MFWGLWPIDGRFYFFRYYVTVEFATSGKLEVHGVIGTGPSFDVFSIIYNAKLEQEPRNWVWYRRGDHTCLIM